MLKLDLDPELEQILDSYAKKDGTTKSALARKAIAEYLEDREDYDLAVEASEDSEPHISLEELIRKYGLEDQLQQEGGEATRQTQSGYTTSDHQLPVSTGGR